jgi:PHD/YefM family antitoxin component YafN of YafNO toxin-antitoxin module
MSADVNPGQAEELLQLMNDWNREKRISAGELAADVAGAVKFVENGDRILVTVNDRIEAVLLSLVHFEGLCDALGLTLAALEKGDGIPHEEVMASLYALVKK